MGIISFSFLSGRIFRWGKYLLLLAALVAVLYWIRFSPVHVAGYRVMERESTTEVMGMGTLEARVQTVVSSKISGRIAQMLADQGDGVGAGQVLAKLDDSELIRQMEIAQSSLAAARASADRVEKDDRNRTALIPGK